MEKLAYVYEGATLLLHPEGSCPLPTGYIPVAALYGMSETERQAVGVYNVIDPPTPEPGFLHVLTGALGVEYHGDDPLTVKAFYSVVEEPQEDIAARLVAQINAFRDARLDGGFEFGGHHYQTRTQDQINFLGTGIMAVMATGQGAARGNKKWLRPDKDFKFITADNQQVPLDAFDMADLYAAGVGFKEAVTFFARNLKDWVADPARTREELLALDVAAPGVEDLEEWP